MNDKPVSDDIMYGRTALREGIPWIVPESREFLEKHIITPDMEVFEWGSGGSTIYFARKCAFVTSVEHNFKWYNDIIGKLKSEDLLHTKAHVLYMRGIAKGDVDNKLRFKPYADVILAFRHVQFDLAFIDGEASSRGLCFWNAIDKVKPGGFVLLDNSDWLNKDKAPRLNEYLEQNDWERYNFNIPGLKWIGQKGTFTWWTSIFRKPEEV